MVRKYSSKKNKQSFYLPGEEISFEKKTAFQCFTSEKDSISVCKNRVLVAILAFLFVYTIITIRLFNVCISFSEDSVATKHIANRPHILNIKRADILDRNGTIIATSLPTVNLYVNPKKILNVQKSAAELVNVLPELDYATTLKKLKGNGHFVYLKRNLSPSQQYEINTLGIPGLEFENGEKRVYPHKNLFSHIIGTTDIDNVGISGIEKNVDSRLRESSIPLRLSIDAGIQDTIREILGEALKKYEAIGATAIVMDVKTSEVVAMVSLPDYDPNTNKIETANAKFNMASKGVYELGSVLKVFNTAMALESGKVKVADVFDASKPLKLKYNLIKDYRGENRPLSVAEILIYSSNIGSARMALKVGGNEQRNFLEKIGFFDEMKIELAEKGQPIVSPTWTEGTIASVSFGYGLAITPLHLITGYCSMINGGIYHNPSLVKSGNKNDGYRVISDNTSKSMKELMRVVVTDGSGKRANIAGYEVAGKTGTANKLSDDGKYVNKKVRTSFVAAFPVSNPQYALMVMMDEPKPLKDTWGFVTSGWNTTPTAGKIITAIAPQLDVEANFDIDELRNSRIIEATYNR